MGRPLKIQKYASGSGIGGAAVAVDQGYPNFGSLTDTVYNSPQTLNSTQFLGVVGGLETTATTTTFPVVKVEAYIANSYSGQAAAVIIRQKGSHKYLVATAAGIDPANAVAGVALRILTVGNTNWQSIGAPAGAGVGTIFTCTAAAGAGTTGTAQEVGVCVLTSDLTPTSGLMSISYFNTTDSTEVAISKLTNKFLLNWSGFVNAAGTSLDSYADNGNNSGPVNYSAEGVFVANFFTDEGTVTKSGMELSGASQSINGTMSLAIVENYTS